MKSFAEVMQEQVKRLQDRKETLLANGLKQLLQDRRTTEEVIKLRQAVYSKPANRS